MKTFEMMTAGELVHYLFTKDGLKEVDFTFDNLDEDPECEPEGWYGVRLLKIFDEENNIFAVGYYGGGSTEVYDATYDNYIEDQELECTKVLQRFMNYWCGYNGGCKKVCVEIEED